jgi:type II secretion system protein F
MPTFHYTALDKAGNRLKGEIAAANERNARREIKKKGLYVVNMDVEGAKRFIIPLPNIELRQARASVSGKELVFFTRQLGTLLRSGFALDDALSAISEQISSPSFHKVILDIDKGVKEGRPLFETMQQYNYIFPDIFCSLVRAGEASGELDSILFKLAEYQENQMKLKNKIVATLMYPAVMLLVCIGVIFVLMTYVVPNIVSALLAQNQELPTITKILISVSGFMAQWWWAMIGAAALVIVIARRYYQTRSGKKLMDHVVLKIPLFGSLSRKVAISRFASTFAVLLKSGVDILRSLNIVKDVVGNVVIQSAIEEGASKLSQGDSLAKPLKESEVFPPIVVKMIEAGQKSGNLDVMLETISRDFDSEVEHTLLGLTSLLEPIIILVMGGFVTMIVFAILMPMQSMMGGVG